MQVDEENARENLQLSKWNDKSQVIGLWLDDMKEKVDHLSKTLVDEPIAIANYKNELEVNSVDFPPTFKFNFRFCILLCYFKNKAKQIIAFVL